MCTRRDSAALTRVRFTTRPSATPLYTSWRARLRRSRAVESRDKILDELWAIALLDNVITEDEATLLHAVEEQLDRFDMLVRSVNRDAGIDFEEFLRMREARKEIFDYALEMALADGKITDDERQLLVRIIEMLPLIR
jgi:uncharacterized tellurite resistance protein B-like protein